MRALLPAFVLLASCGGNVVVDPASTGSGGASSSSSSGTGGSTATSVTATSVTATSVTATSTAATTTSTSSGSSQCPVLAPNDGDACDAPGLMCDFPAICCGGSGVCSNGTWAITGGACDHVCAGCTGTEFGCEPVNTLCVFFLGSGPVASGRCAPNTCGTDPATCACVTPLCGAAGCAQVSGTNVECNGP